jgi:hypothetical protein
MTVWIYDQGEELKTFATEEAAPAWINENDPKASRSNIRSLRNEPHRPSNHPRDAADRGFGDHLESIAATI